MLTQKRAYLPGIGLLHLVPVAADIHRGDHTISPPSYDVHFIHSDRISKANLKEQLLLWAQMTEVNAERISQRFTDELKTALLNDVVVLDEIGALENTENGIVFKEAPTLKNQLSPLPTLHIEPIEVPENEKKSAAAAAQGVTAGATAVTAKQLADDVSDAREDDAGEMDIEDKDENSQWRRIVLILFILAAIIGLITYFISRDNGTDKGSENVATALEESNSTAKYEENATVPTDGNSADGEISDSATEDGTAHEGDESNTMGDEQAGTTADALPTQGEESSTTGKKSDNETGSSATITQDDYPDSNDEQGTTFDESQDKQEVKKNLKQSDNQASIGNETRNSTATSSMQKPSGDCVIIVGAFGDQRNVKRMIKRLEGLGWKVYSKQPYKLTKIGAYVPCDNAGLHNALDKLQHTIEPNAWILKGN